MSTKAFGGWTHAGAGLLLVAGLVFCGIAAEGRLRRLGDGPGRRQRPRLPLADSHGTGGWPIHPHHQLSMARLRPRSSSRVSSLGAWPTSRPPRSISRRFSRPPRRLPCNCWRTAPPSRRRTEFGLNDSVTSFRVASDAFSGNGHDRFGGTLLPRTQTPASRDRRRSDRSPTRNRQCDLDLDTDARCGGIDPHTEGSCPGWR